MKALILAAGKGRRLSHFGLPKPLVKLLGLPLLERVVCSCIESGIEEFVVVTGYRGERIRRFLDRLSRKRKIKIQHVINQDWEKENGLSVLKAEECLKGESRFVLVMADHLFEKSLLDKLLEMDPEDGVVLAIDRDTHDRPEIDRDDVTKVKIRDNRIENIGKDIEEYDGYDTGVFLCSPAIFEAIRRSLEINGDSTLSGGVRVLTKDRKALICDVSGKFWLDVDDERRFRIAEQIMLKRLIKRTDGPVSKRINRPISLLISRWLVAKEISPNLITMTSFMLSILSAFFFSLGGYIWLALGAIFAQLSSIVDGCDGEVARLRYETSDFGGWFDAVLDRYADAFIISALTYHCLRVGEYSMEAVLFVGFAALIGSFMNSYTADKYDGIIRRFNRGGMFRIGRDVRIFLIFIGTLLNLPFLVLVVLALVMNLETIRRILLSYRIASI